MNKFIKGTIAGTAGIALLMGGAGSFALWTDSTTVNAGTISSGTLSIVNNPDDGVWTVNGSVVDINDYKIIPGDVLTYTDGFTVNATGDNLTAHLTVDSLPALATDAASVELLRSLKPVAPVVKINQGASNVQWDGQHQYLTVTDADTPADLSVTISFKFDANGTYAQGGHIDLNNIGFKLTQV